MFTFDFHTNIRIWFVSWPLFHGIWLSRTVALRTFCYVVTCRLLILRVRSVSLMMVTGSLRRQLLVLRWGPWEVFEVEIEMRVMRWIQTLMLLCLALILWWSTWSYRWGCQRIIELLTLNFISCCRKLAAFACFPAVRAIVTLIFPLVDTLSVLKISSYCISGFACHLLFSGTLHHILRLKLYVKLLQSFCLYSFLRQILLLLLH